MEGTIHAGTILIKEGVVLPEGLQVESEACFPGWKLVTGLDGYGLDRKIRAAGWTFFCVAGDLRAATVMIGGNKTLHGAMRRILANPNSRKFNSLEIAKVISKRFLGVPYAVVYARRRHIQKSMSLFDATNSQPWDETKIIAGTEQSGSRTSDGDPPPQKTALHPAVASVVNP